MKSSFPRFNILLFFLFFLSLASSCAAQEYREFEVHGADSLRLREGPSTDSGIIKVLDRGQKMRLIGRSGDWCNVLLPDDTEGWVHENYITEIAAASEQNAAGQEGTARGGGEPSSLQNIFGDSSWQKVDETRHIESIIAEIARKALNEDTIALGSDAGQQGYAKIKKNFENQKNSENSRWEKNLLLAQHALDRANADLTIKEIEEDRKKQNVKTLHQEILSLKEQEKSYNSLLGSLDKNLKKAKENYKEVYLNYRNYYIVLGRAEASGNVAKEMDLAHWKEAAYESSLQEAENECIGSYVRGIQVLKNEKFYQYIESTKSAVAYKLAPSKLVGDCKNDDKGRVTSHYYLSLTPICIQPKRLGVPENGASENQSGKFDIEMNGTVVYDPAKMTSFLVSEKALSGLNSPVAKPKLSSLLGKRYQGVEDFLSAIDHLGFNENQTQEILRECENDSPPDLSIGDLPMLQGLQLNNLQELEKSLSDFYILVSEYYNPENHMEWRKRCRAYGEEVVMIQQQIEDFAGRLSTLQNRLQETRARIETTESEIKEIERARIEYQEKKDRAYRNWKECVLHREIVHLVEEEKVREGEEKKTLGILSRKLLESALNHATVQYRDSIQKYVYDEVKSFLSEKNIQNQPSVIKGYKILLKGLSAGSPPTLTLSAGFVFDLNLPEQYLRPVESGFINSEKIFDDQGRQAYLIVNDLAYLIPEGQKYELKTWLDAYRDTQTANEKRLHGLTGWRLPTSGEIKVLRSGKENQCCIFPELKIPCGAIFWTNELDKSKKSGFADYYRVTTFGFPKSNGESQPQDGAAFRLMVTKLNNS